MHSRGVHKRSARRLRIEGSDTVVVGKSCNSVVILPPPLPVQFCTNSKSKRNSSKRIPSRDHWKNNQISGELKRYDSIHNRGNLCDILQDSTAVTQLSHSLSYISAPSSPLLKLRLSPGSRLRPRPCRSDSARRRPCRYCLWLVHWSGCRRQFK